jgi:hypothetical protein
MAIQLLHLFGAFRVGCMAQSRFHPLAEIALPAGDLKRMITRSPFFSVF